MANILTIDLDALNSAISKYDDMIEGFKQSLCEANKGIEQLRSSDWISGASTAYFMMYEDTWKQNMAKRLLIIMHLRDCLNLAKREYEAIYDELQMVDRGLDL